MERLYDIGRIVRKTGGLMPRFIDAIEGAVYVLSKGSLSYQGAAGNSSHSNSGSGGTTGCGSNSRADRRLEDLMK